MEPFETRRKKLISRLDRAVAIFPAAPVTIRNNDVEHDYRQDSDFYYLTGLDEPDGVLVVSTAHPEHRSAVFVRPRNPEREHWEGPRLGVDEAPARLGVDAAYPISELAQRLPDYLQNAQRLVTRLGGAFDQQVFTALAQTRGRWKTGISWPTEIIDPLVVLHEMRLLKDSHELEAMRRAASITAEAHALIMRETRPGQREYELEARLSQYYRSQGAPRHAYHPIVAGGANATILHYGRNDATIQDADLVLVDSGCEYDGYAADITRTYPANGKFTAEQRDIYGIVVEALQQATALAKPGVTLEAIHEKACEVIIDGLLALGLLTGSREEVLKEQSYKRFYPHRTSHWLGMDVHDVGRYFIQNKARELQPGMVFTIEPGIYIAPSGDQAPRAFQGIGVRIEDDILITDDGHEVLTAAVPTSIEAVESLCGR